MTYYGLIIQSIFFYFTNGNMSFLKVSIIHFQIVLGLSYMKLYC